jgi:DNA mismatch repair protein MutL
MTNTSRIHALPLHLANQIAAGEVIERPASVVKELIENSLDAGATEIVVNIEGAGSQSIQIRDNGQGIHPDDLTLALSRHATSKLDSTEQLSHIASLGFRGEALPSIASISRLTLSSKQAQNDHAWQLAAHTDELTPITHPQGTTVEVRELFFNVPARRHFLKGDKTELNHIVTTLHRLALSQFDTGFQCHFSANSTLKLPRAITAEQRQQRIGKICGKTFLTHSLYIEQDYDDIKLQGWLANAEGHRPQTDVHHFFINGRVIRDRVINHAIRQAYSDFIPAGRYPAFVLYLTMPLDRVDINVHPTKHEVRFRDARLIHGLINKAIHDALGAQPQQGEVGDIPRPIIENTATPERRVAETSSSYNPTPKTAMSKDTTPFGTVINLLSQRYVLTQSEQGPLLIDLQTAEQQLRQQQFQHAVTTNTLSSRPILVPIKLDIDPQHIDALSHHQNQLRELGLDFTIKAKQVLIKTIPSLFAHIDISQLIDTLSNQLSTKTTSDQLIALMQQQLPLIDIQSIEQAQTILKQIVTLAISPNWHRQVDKATLHSLFQAI